MGWTSCKMLKLKSNVKIWARVLVYGLYRIYVSSETLNWIFSHFKLKPKDDEMNLINFNYAKNFKCVYDKSKKSNISKLWVKWGTNSKFFSQLQRFCNLQILAWVDQIISWKLWNQIVEFLSTLFLKFCTTVYKWNENSQPAKYFDL